MKALALLTSLMAWTIAGLVLVIGFPLYLLGSAVLSVWNLVRRGKVNKSPESQMARNRMRFISWRYQHPRAPRKPVPAWMRRNRWTNR